MQLTLKRIDYSDLNSRQKENYNFHKISAVLADFGYTLMRLSDDWNGADFLAPHIDGETILRVQLKGRLTFQKSYKDLDLWIAFPDGDSWYLYPHDQLLQNIMDETDLLSAQGSWELPFVVGSSPTDGADSIQGPTQRLVALFFLLGLMVSV